MQFQTMLLKNVRQGLGIGVGIAAGMALFSAGSVVLPDLMDRLQLGYGNFVVTPLEKKNCPSASSMCRSFEQRLADGWEAFNADAGAIEAFREYKKFKSQFP